MSMVSLKHKLETQESRKAMELKDQRALIERDCLNEMKAKEFNMKQTFERELAHLWYENDKIKQEFETKADLVSKLSTIV